MAQTNYTPIYLYNSGTASNVPLAANLGAGELAINYADGKLFYKDGSAAIQVIGWKTTPTTAGGTGLTSYTAGDLPYYASGSALSKLGIGTANYVLTSSGTAPQYVAQSTLSVGSATNATNTAITDNTSSSATWYPTIVSATTGNLPQTTSSTKLSFVPSTGTLTATSHAGAWAGSTIGTTYGGTGLTSFTANGLVYASSTSVLATSSSVQLYSTGGFSVGYTTDPGANNLSVSGGIWIGQTSSPNGNVLDVKAAGEVSALNRNTSSDGVIIRYQKQGSTVGYISTNTYSLPSDSRIKKNIENINLGLDFINSLRPVQYNTIFQDPKNESRKNFGLIAQEVEQTLAKFNKTTNDVTFLEKFEEYEEGESQYGLGYQNLVPVLIQAIQELNKKFDAYVASHP
jgi:hypothetical protein